MKLPFEQWLEKQNIAPDSLSLFEEAIICYKAGAYRAALLISFMGFLSVIKDKILNASKPDNIHEREWERIVNDLRNDDKWDKETLECIKRNDPQKIIFTITDDLRRQVFYWKDRRNDCAHSKRNKINYAYVETFWLFVSSNLGKFAVNGNLDSILLKIRKHFDISYTSRNKSPDNILSEVEHSIDEKDISKFCIKLHQLFIKEDKDYCNYRIFPFTDVRKLEFWDLLLNINEIWEREVFKYIKSESYLFDGFINLFPQRVGLLNGDMEFIRNLWFERVSEYDECFTVLSELIRHNLIPDEEIKEAFDRVISKATRDILTEEHIWFLDSYGFSEIFENEVFNKYSPLIDDFNWGNNNYDWVITYFKVKGLNKKAVLSLNKVFQESKYYPRKARMKLEEFFNTNEDFKAKYVKICEEEGITPTRLLINE
jgi:hypothetical protein